MKTSMNRHRDITAAHPPEPDLENAERLFWAILVAILVIAALCTSARADLALETETARLLPPGRFQLGGAFEYQKSPDGQEFAAPLAVEFGVIDRLEMLIEPVAFTSIQPNGGSPGNGLGDTEATLTYLVLDERPYIPALAIAGEVKVPSASNRQIGSGEFDYRVYGVASKRFGDVDVHFNLGYTITGEPSGAKTRNPIDLELAAEWFVHPKFDLFAEVTYVGSSLRSSVAAGETANVIVRRSGAVIPAVAAPTGAPGSGTITSELAGEEIVGSVGVRYHVNPRVDVFGSFSYDNNDAKLFRTGFSFSF